MIEQIFKIICMGLALYFFYYLHKKFRNKVFSYVNQYSKNDCFINIGENKLQIKLYNDDMYLMSQNFRERCYKKLFKNKNIIKSNDELSIVNDKIKLNNIDLDVFDQDVKKGEIYYKDKDGQNLSIALKDKKEKCIVFGKVITDNFDKIDIDDNTIINNMGIIN